jgi:uncharacterized protein (TIGR00645 family)
MFQVFIERFIYATRWLLAPIYVGLGLALFALTFKFCQTLWHMYATLLETDKSDLVLELLSMIDMVLVGSLLVMVMIGSYENSVSQLDIGDDQAKLAWLGKLNPHSLKIKLAAAIVAISSIHLLEVFMNADDIPDNKIFWYVVLHLTFVLSAAIMAGIDKLLKHGPPATRTPAPAEEDA